MDQKVNHVDYVQALAARLGLSKADTDAFVKVFFETIEENLLKDKLVKIKGLGTFKLVGVSERESVDVNTGERIRIAGHEKVSFTPDAALRDQVNRPFAEFETTILNESTSQEQMESMEPVVEEAKVQEEEKAEEVQKVQEVQVEEKVAEAEPAKEDLEIKVPVTPQQPTQDVPEKQEEKGGHTTLYAMFFVLLFAVVLAAGYFAGLDKMILSDEEETVVAIEEPEVVEEPVVVKEPTAEELAKNYPQVEDGEYWIVGEIGTDTMKVGTNLYKIARKQLGNKDLMPYIVVFNGIENPNVLPPGYVMKIPKMVKKVQE